jgi:ABC-type Fe3+ transport system permease subunit
MWRSPFWASRPRREALANLRESLGLNEPPMCAISLAGRRPDRRSSARADQWAGHRQAMGRGLGNTLFLAFWAAVISVPLAILLGLVAVRYRNGPLAGQGDFRGDAGHDFAARIPAAIS